MSEIAALPDGTEIKIRQISAADKEAIADGFARLSPESRYRRFFAPLERLTPADLRYLTEVDHHAHEALIAYDAASGESIGVARFVVSDDPTSAEVAVTVVDDWHHRGVASVLLDRLVIRAREEGIARFIAIVLDGNDDALALFRHLDPDGRPRKSASGNLELLIEIPDAGEELGETNLGDALRKTAEHRIVVNPWRVLTRRLRR